MRLVYYRHESGTTNLGDELNLWIWDKLLPQAGSHLRPDLQFYAIGTLLRHPMPAGPKLVFGSGAGYGAPPHLDPSWDIRFVRGKYTATLLGLSEDAALTDPGILVGLMKQKSSSPKHEIAFMPRFTSAQRFINAHRPEDMHLIDPRRPVEECLDEIADCGLLMSEALHGAVVADAMRIPWIAVKYEQGHAFKWKDWLSTRELEWKPFIFTSTTGVGMARVAHKLQRLPIQLTPEPVAKRLFLGVLQEIRKLTQEILKRKGLFLPELEPPAEIGAIPVRRVN